MEIKVNACLAKGQVVNPVPEGVLVVDTGGLAPSTFDGISGVDEACRKSIAMGHVDHHTIDMLLAKTEQPKKCATQMVVDYFDEILKYCKEHNVKEVQIHQDSDMDAMTAGWLLKEGLKNGKLPKCAKQMAAIVNEVDYAKYRPSAEEYITSFPGCIEAITSTIRSAKENAIFSNPANFGSNHRLTDEAVKKLNQVDSETIKEVFPVYDALAKEIEKDPTFDLNSGVKSLIEKSPAVDEKTKEAMKTGLQQTIDAQNKFQEALNTAEEIDFNFMNPLTNQQDTAKIVIMQSKDPLVATNLGYAHYGKDAIMAVYAGTDRNGGDVFDIGCSPEAAKKFETVMKDIAIEMNKAEGNARLEVIRETGITPNASPERRALIERLSALNQRPQFPGADISGIYKNDPHVLVGRGTLVAAARNTVMESDTPSGMSFKKFGKILRNYVSKTKVNIMAKFKQSGRIDR